MRRCKAPGKCRLIGAMEITLQFIDRDDERKSVYLRRLVAVAKLSSSDLDVDAQCLFVEVGKLINHSVWIALH